MSMDEETAIKLKKLREDVDLTKAAERLRSGLYYAKGPYTCKSLGCGKTIRTPRALKALGGKRYVSLAFCSQECADAWHKTFKVPGTRYEWYDGAGNLKGYYVPKKGYVTLDELYALQEREEETPPPEVTR